MKLNGTLTVMQQDGVKTSQFGEFSSTVSNYASIVYIGLCYLNINARLYILMILWLV